MNASPTPPSNTPHLVLTSFPSERVAKKIAGHLIEEKLAACVSLIPGAQSMYFWEGAIQQDVEWLGLIKTQASTYKDLEKRLLELHPYETPEVLAIDIAQGSPAYLKWLGETLAR
ncbi:MAG: periplasmic divalent cation tolerance protein [Verrucomicrobiales bacterium]|jgi:periplasmic divalent cation tolerance protein